MSRHHRPPSDSHSRDGIEITSLSAIEHIIRHRPSRIKKLFVATTPKVELSGRIKAVVAIARQNNIVIDANLSHTASPDSVKALLPPYEYTELSKFYEGPARGFILALDHLQDPQNLGALCRTAEGLGAIGVILPKDRGATVSSGVYHASVGAIETIPVALVTNLSEALRRLKELNYWIVGTKLGPPAKSLAEMPTFDKVVIVMGTELEGLSPLIEKTCDWLVEIPLAGKVQSLNVSAAGAILMHYCYSRGLNQ